MQENIDRKEQIKEFIAKVRPLCVDNQTLIESLNTCTKFLDNKASPKEIQRVKGSQSSSEGLPKGLDNKRLTLVGYETCLDNNKSKDKKLFLLIACCKRLIQATDLEFSVTEEDLGFVALFLDLIERLEPNV